MSSVQQSWYNILLYDIRTTKCINLWRLFNHCLIFRISFYRFTNFNKTENLHKFCSCRLSKLVNTQGATYGDSNLYSNIRRTILWPQTGVYVSRHSSYRGFRFPLKPRGLKKLPPAACCHLGVRAFPDSRVV